MAAEARARVAPLPDWYPKFAGTRLFFRALFGRRLEGGKRTGYWTNARVAALRWAIFGWCVSTLFLLVWGWLALSSFVPIQVWLAVWAAYGLKRGGMALWDLFKNWRLRGRILEPLHDALHDPTNLVGFADDERPERYLHVPLNWDKGDGATVKIELRSASYVKTPEQKDQFVSVVAATMGATVRAASVKWHTAGRRPYVLIHPAFPPPKVAWFADYIEQIEKARKPGEIAWGVQDHSKLLKVNITGDTPHGVIAGTTGRGKSQAEAGSGCQLLHDGFVAAVLDYKGRSLPCFIDLPNVSYARDVEECDWLALALRDEFYRRRDLLKDWKRGDKKPDIGPSIAILIEESDSLMSALRALNERRVGPGKKVPAIDALNELKFMGRELRMHQLSVTQSGSARAAGGGDARSQFGWALISGDKPTWQKVTGLTEKPPPISPIVGRWHLYRNGGSTEVQVFGFQDPPEASDDEKMEEARAYALSGRVTPVPDNLKLVSVRPAGNVSEPNEQAFRLKTDTGLPSDPSGLLSGRPRLHVVPDAPESLLARIARGVYDDPVAEDNRVMSVREAVAAGVLVISESGFRSARQSGKGPQPVGKRAREGKGAPELVFRVSDLIEFERQRSEVPAHVR